MSFTPCPVCDGPADPAGCRDPGCGWRPGDRGSLIGEQDRASARVWLARIRADLAAKKDRRR